MVFAAYYDTGFKIVLLLHILSVLVAFSPMFVLPLLARSGGEATSGAVLTYLQRFATPAVVLAGFFGLAMIGMSDKVYKFSQTWVSLALLLWIIQVALFIFAILPAQRKAAGGDAEAARRVPMFTGMIHLCLLVLIYLMIWRPGAPSFG
jgi:uncharacterized membrane protein